MNAQIVMFPEAQVAAVEHSGSAKLEYVTAKKLIEWRRLHQPHPDRHHSLSVHYTDRYTTPPVLEAAETFP